MGDHEIWVIENNKISQGEIDIVLIEHLENKKTTFPLISIVSFSPKPQYFSRWVKVNSGGIIKTVMGDHEIWVIENNKILQGEIDIVLIEHLENK